MRKTKNKNTLRGIPVVSAKDAKQQSLYKIGEIASAFEILSSTVNFYTREGLLPEDARSVGGYRLYHKDRTIAKLRSIEVMQLQKRLTIAEIKKKLS